MGALGRTTLRVPAIGLALALVLAGGCTELENRRGSWLETGGRAVSETGTAAPTRLVGASDVPGSTAVGNPLGSAEFYRGTGQLYGTPPSEPAVAVNDDGGVTFNFVNAEIGDVVAAILGEALGLSYELDPRVQGGITVRTARPVPRDAVIPTLEDILAARGAALVKVGELYRVLPIDAAAATLGGGVRIGGSQGIDQGFGLHIFPLRYAGAATLRSVLESFIPPGRTLRAEPDRNMLIFSGTANEARDFESLVATFDYDRMAGMSFGLYPIRYADLETLVVELKAVFGGDEVGGAIRFLPVERLNAVLAVSPRPAALDEIQTWIDRLDRGQEGVGRRIYVYRVQNGDAVELAEVLAEVFDAPATTIGGGDRLAPGLEPVELSRPADPAGGEGGPAPAADYVDPIIGGIGLVTGGTGRDGDTVRITADPRNNALLVRANPTEYRMILGTLRELDVIPLQTLIEATIAVVTLRDNLQYGLQWFFRAGDSEFRFTDASTGTVGPSAPGFSYFLSGTDVQVALNALAEITDVKVLSSPQLLVLDNESARLQVGDEVPIAVQSVQSIDDPSAPIVNTIEYRDTGVILEVTPRVNASGLVILEIMQEVSDVSETSSSTLNSPIISQRLIESTVAVQGGETIALGGLIRDTRTDIVTGIPLLADIPLLGNLFKSTTDRIERTELLVLLTPRVVRDLQDARDVTRELRERLTSLDAAGSGG
ncbi:MAG: type II secretion system secretin GspD [Inquilinus sp.]|nr:type II secretion system secretin GspD [Inquilinus sp.]